ncbi:GGDEF domain-containing protein [Alkalicoccus halolimnae]|uniref:GGDEF domain-containing protein n=1 Tax=Alkalicoccus halolimnae TaxID=1667239 RepID=A0A5C7F8W2_9BACI|nr:GGDEF domain-containing protein [Alkalicoccus halolimnae]TXF81430.1 diguanylate cyclase [Alkalicoccus halolimnae]
MNYSNTMFYQLADIRRLLPAVWLAFLLYTIFFLTFESWFLAAFSGTAAAFLLLIQFKSVISRVYTLIIVIFLLTLSNALLTSWVLGSGSGFYFYLFIFPIFGWIAFPRTHMRWIIGTSVIAFFLSYFIPPASTQALSSMTLNSLFGINAIIFVLVVSYVFYLYFNKNRDLFNQLEWLAAHDPLTGLLNRRKMTQLLEHQLKADKTGSILLMDLDDFKSINDTYGHDSGDEVLTQLSEIIKSHVPEEGFASRWGGEEFLVYFPLEDPGKVKGYFEHMLADYQAHVFHFSEKPVTNLSFTAGAANLQHSLTSSVLEADNALYTGKYEGKGRLQHAASQ